MNDNLRNELSGIDKVLIKLIQSHFKTKIQKKLRIWQIKTKLYSERPPASVSNNYPRECWITSNDKNSWSK